MAGWWHSRTASSELEDSGPRYGPPGTCERHRADRCRPAVPPSRLRTCARHGKCEYKAPPGFPPSHRLSLTSSLALLHHSRPTARQQLAAGAARPRHRFPLPGAGLAHGYQPSHAGGHGTRVRAGGRAGMDPTHPLVMGVFRQADAPWVFRRQRRATAIVAPSAITAFDTPAPSINRPFCGLGVHRERHHAGALEFPWRVPPFGRHSDWA